MKQFWQWLYPGLSVKRWMFLFSIGATLFLFGTTLIMNYQVFGILEEEILRIAFQLTGNYSYTFLVVLGSGLVVLGAGIMLFAVRKLMKRVLNLLAPDRGEVSKRLLSKLELSRGANIVAVGGGHGLSNLLRGLKRKTSNLSAVVTVADDGGSSGRLREEMDIIAPGDLRNCLVALSDKESVLEQIFQYRFAGKGELAGHSLGNLFLAALIKEFGNVQNALEAAGKVLNIRGRVMPATTEKVSLRAHMSDGADIWGESEITAYCASGKVKIETVSLEPSDVIAVGDALEAVRKADLITLGPGSLYTSILPNLLVPELLCAIRNSDAPCLYICNVMTQPGETTGYTVGDHVRAIVNHVGKGVIDYVLANTGRPRKDIAERYAEKGATVVETDEENLRELGVTLIRKDLLGEEKGAVQQEDLLAEEIIKIQNLIRTHIEPDALAEYLGRH